MIVREFYETRHDGVNLYKTYSDKGYYIKQMPTEVVYGEAVDVEDAPYTYEETDELIETTTDEIESYDYRVGYPNKLEF
jgi:hypothetical protein